MKGIIYTRVSSDEQVKGTSLDFQEEICRKYCADRGIEIVEVFREEGASAKSTDRTNFLRAIERCRKGKGTIGAFVVAKVDRFARNTEDHFYVRKLLLGFGTSLHSVTEPIGDSPIGKLIETVLAGTADFDNAVRKQRCSDGMSARVKEGIWPWHPPIGYLCANNKKSGLKKTTADPPDPLTFPIIQAALRELAQGMHSKASFAARLDALGLAKARGKSTPLQFVETLLRPGRLKFYAGWLRNPFDSTGDTYFRGQHKPMLSDIDVHKIQLVLKGRARPSANHRTRENPLFPLRRHIRCDSCRTPLTGSSPKGNGGTYRYYHCWKSGCPLYGRSTPADVLERLFTEYLSSITPKRDWLALFKETVIDLWKEQGRSYHAHALTYRKTMDALQAKRTTLFQMREDGSYTKEDFLERKAQIDSEILATKISLSEARIDEFDLEAAATYATSFIADLGRQWRDMPPHLRGRFQLLVFPEGIYFNPDSGLRTTKLGSIYELSRASATPNYSLVDRMRFSWNQLVIELHEWSMLKKELTASLAA